jgi:hypothetical protein
MVDSVFWSSVWLPLTVGAFCSLLAEMLLLPQPQWVWKRGWGAGAIHFGLWLVMFAAELLLWRRPVFAAINVLALELFIILVSRIKYDTLREPFIVQDFDYFIDVICHPWLYIPFLGFARALMAAIAFGLSIWLALVFESSSLHAVSADAFIVGTGLLALGGALLLWLGGFVQPSLTWNPADDLIQLGLAASLWHYGVMERRSRNEPLPESLFSAPTRAIAGPLPPVVVVQSESFFDPRRKYEGIRKEILQHFDHLCSEAMFHGSLKVPAWGANTVRTEFAFLSGLSPNALGVHRFNPYRSFASRGVPTLASFLKRMGYRTVCVHPYPAGFYSRDVVYPELGFDEFIDIAGFPDASRCGMYIADEAVAELVCTLLDGDAKVPLFVFVITMENHGPLDLERIPKDEVACFHDTAPPSGCEDLTTYLSHLANADRMIGRLRARLNLFPEAWLCMFGDHVPIMPEVYRQLGPPDGTTDYVLWRAGQPAGTGTAVDDKVEELGGELLRRMGYL